MLLESFQKDVAQLITFFDLSKENASLKKELEEKEEGKKGWDGLVQKYLVLITNYKYNQQSLCYKPIATFGHIPHI